MLHFYKKKKNDKGLVVVFGMSLLVFVACAVLIVSYVMSSYKNQKGQKAITDIIDDLDSNSVDGQLVDRYESIRDKYPHIVGRLQIQNKNKINDLVVMHTPDEPDYYLSKDANGKYSAAGTAYLDHECSVESMTDNYLIYAHAMKDLTQFGCLRHYKKKSYWNEYPTITFETMYDEPTEYEIFAVFYSQRYTVGYEGFKYYKFKDAKNKEEFDYYIDNVLDLAEYDTGIKPEYGEQIITLSTCDYTKVKEEGRFVVCARKKNGRLPKDNLASDSDVENITPLETNNPEPTQAPQTLSPTRTPTKQPTKAPTVEPTVEPTQTPQETVEPTQESEILEPTQDTEVTMPALDGGIIPRS